MDTIANFLSQLKNAYLVRSNKVELVHTRIIEELSHILESEGYLTKVHSYKDGDRKMIALDLKYDINGEPCLHNIRRVSKSGQRIYRGRKEITDVMNGLGVRIISTSQGIMTSRQARVKHLGGEVLCEVW